MLPPTTKETTMTTIIEITDEQIEAFCDEAGVAGDTEQAALCRRALAGDADARRACARVIDAARAMIDDA